MNPKPDNCKDKRQRDKHKQQSVRKSEKQPSARSSQSNTQNGAAILQDINHKLEFRRKSLDLDGIDPLEKEVFNQTLIYAAKSALNTIRAEKEDQSNSDSDDAKSPNNLKCRERKDSCVSDDSRRVSVIDMDKNVKITSLKKTRRRESSILIPVKTIKGLTPEQIEEIKRSFGEIDVNKDGRISKKELTLAAYRLGMNPTEKEINDMLKSADDNGDGYIDFNEYVKMMKQNYVTIDIERERMKAAFGVFDVDGDGFITKTELTKVLVTDNSGITLEDIDEILRDADVDDNERIDFNEFVDSTICAKLF